MIAGSCVAGRPHPHAIIPDRCLTYCSRYRQTFRIVYIFYAWGIRSAQGNLGDLPLVTNKHGVLLSELPGRGEKEGTKLFQRKKNEGSLLAATETLLKLAVRNMEVNPSSETHSHILVSTI